GGADRGSFQPPIVIEELHGFRGERQEGQFLAFAPHAQLRFGKQHVVLIQTNTSAERSPCRSIKPTMAKSREERKLDQKRATSSTESGTMLRLGTFTRSRLMSVRGPLVFAAKKLDENHGRFGREHGGTRCGWRDRR